MDIQSLHNQIQQQSQRCGQVQSTTRQIAYRLAYLRKKLQQERQIGLLLALRSGRNDAQTSLKTTSILMASQIMRMHTIKTDIKNTEQQLQELYARSKSLNNRIAVLEKLEHQAIGGNAYALHQADLVGVSI